MSDKLIINLKQNRGEQNAVRIFFNEEFLDEVDTTTELDIKEYDIDILDNDVNILLIEVFRSHTSVESNTSNNILSSNTVTIDKVDVFHKKYDVVYSYPYFNFKRKKDPVYEIWAKQNNVDYKTITHNTKTSSGDGCFILDFIPKKLIQKRIDPNKIIHNTLFNFLTSELWIGSKDQYQTGIWSNVIFDTDTHTISKDSNEIVSLIKNKLKLDHEDNILDENAEININKVIKLYEDQ
jgi:hypothetical protein